MLAVAYSELVCKSAECVEYGGVNQLAQKLLLYVCWHEIRKFWVDNLKF